MQIDLQPKQLAEAAGISPSHASNILSGNRGASTEIALTAFRAFGVRLGLLAEMTDADIAKLVAQQLTPAECHGADACASDPDQRADACASDGEAMGETGVHIAHDSAPLPPPSTGQSGVMSRDNSYEGMVV
jgi:transcriptional regulator with XRE-family HTH domain